MPETKKDAPVTRKDEEKAQAEQAKQDEADVEVFLAYHRGHDLLRDPASGSLDLEAVLERRAAEKDAEKSDED